MPKVQITITLPTRPDQIKVLPPTLVKPRRDEPSSPRRRLLPGVPMTADSYRRSEVRVGQSQAELFFETLNLLNQKGWIVEAESYSLNGETARPYRDQKIFGFVEGKPSLFSVQDWNARTFFARKASLQSVAARQAAAGNLQNFKPEEQARLFDLFQQLGLSLDQGLTAEIKNPTQYQSRLKKMVQKAEQLTAQGYQVSVFVSGLQFYEQYEKLAGQAGIFAKNAAKKSGVTGHLWAVLVLAHEWVLNQLSYTEGGVLAVKKTDEGMTLIAWDAGAGIPDPNQLITNSLVSRLTDQYHRERNGGKFFRSAILVPGDVTLESLGRTWARQPDGLYQMRKASRIVAGQGSLFSIQIPKHIEQQEPKPLELRFETPKRSNAPSAKSEVRFTPPLPSSLIEGALYRLADISLSQIQNGDTQQAIQTTMEEVFGSEEPPQRPASRRLNNILDAMKRGEVLIDVENVPAAVDTVFGRIDLSLLNFKPGVVPQAYQGDQGALFLARDLDIAHRLGLITIFRFQGSVSPVSPARFLKTSGAKASYASGTWSDGLLLHGHMREKIHDGSLGAYQGDEGQLRFYQEIFGHNARDKSAGSLYGLFANSFNEIKDLDWHVLNENLGTAADLRADLAQKIADGSLIRDYAGNDGQVRYYLEFLGDKARDKHAGNLFSVASSLITHLKGLNWTQMSFNLGDVIDIRSDLSKKIADGSLIRDYAGNDGQLQYYIDFLGEEKAESKHAGHLYTVVSSLIKGIEGLGWEFMGLNLGEVLELRAQVSKKIEDGSLLRDYSGDEGQIQYYLDFFGTAKAKTKSAGSLFAAITSLTRNVKGLDWHLMRPNLGDVIRLRADIAARIEDGSLLRNYPGDDGQIQYYLDFFGKNKAGDKNAQALFSAISNLIKNQTGLSWGSLSLNLGDAIALRADIQKRIKNGTLLRQYTGDEGQIQYYLDFFGEPKARGKNTASLYAAHRRLTKTVPGLNWQGLV
ncbi:MAG: hypothetical protein KBC91_08125, partial [Candidatus Omnitrophica bacterium]|nr:hypothetical protein [Candidatus Omnitrophota bacterium]